MSILERNAETSAVRGGGALAAVERSSALKDNPLPETKKFMVVGRQLQTLARAIPESANFAEQVFNSLVALKVSVSQYAMHLSTEERHRIFEELDSVINVEDWHEGDTLPKINAFKEFLKWMIYSKYSKWISIGVSDDGSLLVAWKTPRVLLTAKFSGLVGQEDVRWTAQTTSPAGETGYVVGRCPLRVFAEEAKFRLEGATNEGE
jgi:hypothetical protein